ncbi:MAG: AAA family ATPase [Ignavibacteriales bacterium]|jgi:tRNA(Ser,Leu) C12 N-acetylase TAN1|nr:AAA family ATPase [Ignavibacteriales bacterium]
MKTPKSIPYGLADFRSLILNNFYYVDRTSFIRKIEESHNYLFFLRPRRFGKSLTISMLEYYYGIQYKDEFDSMFSGLFIGNPENTTKGKNNYFVLRFDFTGINTSNIDDVLSEFNKKVQNALKTFNDNYKLIDEEKYSRIMQNIYPSATLSEYITEVLTKLDHKIMVLIDEYDHFTNEIFSFQNTSFVELVSQNGFVRKFYESIKFFAGTGVIERFFATGVTPVTLDSMTSGFNIGTNISLEAEFNEMAGFTNEEVEKMIYDLLPGIQKIEADKILTDASSWYNGSLFSKRADTRLYNPALLLRFLSKIEPVTLQYPDDMVDNNILTDFSKITNLTELGKLEDNLSVIDTIIKEGSYPSELTTIFTFERDFTEQDFASLLYYNGLLTIKGVKDFDLYLQIPNYVIKEVYWEFFASVMQKEIEIDIKVNEIRQAIKALANLNDPLPLMKIVETVLITLSNRDFINFDEKYVKMLIFVYASLAKRYKIKSEPEVNLNYPDLMLLNSQSFFPEHQQLFEVKYIKREAADSLEKVKSSAISQVRRYMELPEIKEIKNLKFWVIIFTGNKCSDCTEVIRL